MVNPTPNEPTGPQAEHLRYVSSLLSLFNATAEGSAFLKLAEEMAVAIVKADTDVGIPFGPLAPYASGEVFKGIVFGMNAAIHSRLSYEQWHAMGGCKLNQALMEGAAKTPGVTFDHTSN